MAIAMAISEELKPEIQDSLQELSKDIRDHQAIGYMNMQAQKYREGQLERRRHKDFEPMRKTKDAADQSLSERHLNDQRLKVQSLISSQDHLGQQIQESNKQSEKRHAELQIQLERLANQVAYLIGGNPWEQPQGEADSK